MGELKTNSVSVIMPVYNGAKFLGPCIESILNQSFGDFEFIIIDDASSDNSQEVINKYRDPRIKLLRNTTNTGQTKTLNKAIAQAKGEYLARIDQDDLATRERLREQVKFLRKYADIALVGTSVLIINENGKKIGLRRSAVDQAQIKLEMLFHNPIAHSSVMLRKEALSGTGVYDECFTFAQDYELWSRMLVKGYKIANMSEPFLIFRRHGWSSTVNLSSDKFYHETTQVMRRNTGFLCATDISPEEAQRLCRLINAPQSLSAAEFEGAIQLFDLIFAAFLRKQGYSFQRLKKSAAQFKYILALACIEKNNLPAARHSFWEAFKFYPYSLNPLLYSFATFLGKGACARLKPFRNTTKLYAV